MAAGASRPVSSPVLNSGDSEQSIEYRSLSITALLALVLGLLSPLFFGAALLILVPLAGIVLSIFALRQIATSEGALAGHWAAIVGLVLSSAMLVAPYARDYVIRNMRTQQAEAFTRDWLSMLTAGHAKDAFRLTRTSTQGTPPPEPGQKTPPTDPFETFMAYPIVKNLSAAGAGATIRLVDTIGYDPQAFPHVFVNQVYEVIPAGKSDTQPIKVRIAVERARVAKEGRSRWMVWAFDDGEKPNPAPAAKP